MASPSQSRTLVSHIFDDDGYLPAPGEIAGVHLSHDLAGPGSVLSSLQNLPSQATSRNYHHAVALNVNYSETVLEFNIFPIPSYSGEDEHASGLMSTTWLLNQPLHIQQLHIPLPHQISTSSQAQPHFPTPAVFGETSHVGGWNNRRPSWVFTVSQVAIMKTSTKVCILPCI
jgi:hypothetical protein